MPIQPVTLSFCHDVYVTHTSGVKIDTNVQYETVVSPPEQIHVYTENPQPRIRTVELLHMYEMLPWSIVQSLIVYSVDNKKQ